MARHRNRQIVRSAGGAHRARGTWLADRDGNLGVARRFAGLDFLQCLPHAALEGCAANIERKCVAGARRFDQCHDFRDA